MANGMADGTPEINGRHSERHVDGHRERLERAMAAHPQLAEALAFLASVDTSVDRFDDPRRPERWDHELIARIVTPGAAVLDLGCGDGELLARLMADKGCRGQGIEVDPDGCLSCLSRGVPVLEVDLDHGLGMFADGGFDYVVLETTLQTVNKPEVVLAEMLRVGRTGIISFPNFGHWWVRTQLLIEGKMPVTEKFPHTWYGTPNIHNVTVRDFHDWCTSHGVTIREQWAYADGEYHPLIPADNVLAEEALFVIAAG